MTRLISSSPQTVASAPLSDLLVPGSYIQADGAEFSNFSVHCRRVRHRRGYADRRRRVDHRADKRQS